ncbi:MAG: CoB--CoM heterodisulfide reductase iron-sulfur subunit A family protein [Candidatus Helarchaeota archaeon]|nr:CoB--CoM heterodisulfide reductase iron-sulfur subunit A family protein [Candidatus Helarchaeota archaeon]
MSSLEKVGSVLVIGGGVAGIQASLDLAEMGFKVYLVEKSPSIGGRMSQLDKTFPTNDCSLCILAPKMVEVFRHQNINMMTYCEVIGVEGEAGNFTVSINKKARYVDETECKGCGDCAAKCPVRDKFPDEFNMGLGKRGAIYTPFPQAVPPVYLIDKDNCLFFQKGICKVCQKFCKANCVDFEMKDQEVKLNVGAIVVVTGYDQIDPSILPQYGYHFENVITGLEFERLMCASGPTRGHIKRVSDDKHPHKIAMLSCVGSRNERGGVPYCSSVCCMYIAKECIITKEHAPDTDMFVFKSDVRSYGKGFNEFIQRAQEEYGVKYITGRVAFVEEDPETKNLIIYYENMETGESKEMEVDLVVLAVALVPSKGTVELAKVLNIDIDINNFFTEKSEIDPVESSRSGIYICGYGQAPKDIPESVADASGAAAKAAELLSSVRGTLAKKKIFELPEKEIKPDDEPRIGVMVCHCGINIGGVVNVPEVVEYVKTLPNVIHVEENLYSCSSDSQQRIKELIAEHNLNRYIVASCTPRTHEPLFALTCREGGLNPYLFELVNIRDQCSWVHMNEPEAATQKAKDLLRMTISKSRLLRPLQRGQVQVVQHALVIGGGISGMTAALNIANEGYQVYLVTNEEKLGGILNQVYKVFPSGEKAEDILAPLLKEIEKNDRIEVFTSSKIKNAGGYVGNFKAEIEDIDGKVIEKEIGVVLVATGGKELKPKGYLKYGEYEQVITQLELEQKLKEGSISKDVKDVVMLLCANARENEGLFTYCSKICCSVAIKNAMILKEINPDINVTILYRDIQMAGKVAEQYYRKSREKITYVQYNLEKLPKVTKNTDNRINVNLYNVLNTDQIELNCDLFVLATPMVPQSGVEELAQFLKIPTMKDIPPFFLEAHVKLRPLDFATEGIFLCGTAQWPKPLHECASQALGAAARASRILAAGVIETEGIISEIDPDKCIACGRCREVCAFNAIEEEVYEKDFENVKLIEVKSRIIPALCKGCGTCAPICPVSAITSKHFTTPQLKAMVKSYLTEE